MSRLIIQQMKMSQFRIDNYVHKNLVDMDINTQFLLPDSIEGEISGEQDLGMWILKVSLSPKKGTEIKDLLSLRSYTRRADL